MHKPSILWPPPTDGESDTVRQSIRSRLRRVAGLDDQSRLKTFLGSRSRAPHARDGSIISEQVDLGASTSAPNVIGGQCQQIVLEAADGEILHVDSQIQLYAPNNLIPHPLISHCGAYLGGLPPLFFIAGDQEVLRDEIIYTWVFSPSSSSPLMLFQSSPSSKPVRVLDPSRGQTTLSQDHKDRSKVPRSDESPSPGLRWMRTRIAHPFRVHHPREILLPSYREFLSVRDRGASLQS